MFHVRCFGLTLTMGCAIVTVVVVISIRMKDLVRAAAAETIFQVALPHDLQPCICGSQMAEVLMNRF